MRRAGFAVAMAFWTAAVPAGATPLFMGLGPNQVTDVSGDGSLVVGTIRLPAFEDEVAIWTAAEGWVGVGDLPGGRVEGVARGISDDGSTIVGSGETSVPGPIGSDPSFPDHAARWTQSGGWQDLGVVPGRPVYSDSVAAAVSADGSVVVGSNARFGFRWTEAGGMTELLPLLPAGPVPTAVPLDVSGDGSRVAGYAGLPLDRQAVLWDGTTPIGLGFLAGATFSEASAISADGSAVVGASGIEPALWSEANGWVGMGLGLLPGADFAQATDVSADGTRVVGSIEFNAGSFFWDPTHGIRLLADVLTQEYGLDLTGWQLFEARAISADGTTIIGRGRNPSGQAESWIAMIPAVPEPAGLALGASAALLALARRRALTPSRAPAPRSRA